MLEQLDRYLEAEGDDKITPAVDQNVQHENILSRVVEDVGTMPLLRSSSLPTPTPTPQNGSPGQHHIHRITDDELQPLHIQEERRRQRVGEILSRTGREREQENNRIMDQFVSRLQAAQSIRKQQFEELKQAIEREFQDLEAELENKDYYDELLGECNFQHLTGSEYFNIDDEDDENKKEALNTTNFLHTFKVRDDAIRDEIKQWKENLNDSAVKIRQWREGLGSTNDDAVDSGLLDQIGATMESLDLSSSAHIKNAAGGSDVNKTITNETLDDLLGFEFHGNENNYQFPPNNADPNLSQSTIDIDTSKLDEHIMNLVGKSHGSDFVDTSNKSIDDMNIDLSSSQPARPVSSLSLMGRQHPLPSSSTSKKDNKSVTFNLDSAYSSSFYENNGSSSQLESGIFLPPRHMTRQEDAYSDGNDNYPSSENDVTRDEESNKSIIHCNFDMSSRGPGKCKRGRTQ